jgi:hypothetical protein
MLIIFLIISILAISENNYIIIRSPVRAEITEIKLSKIGQFGLLRKPRPYIPAHYHTGIDIKRPTQNYIDEPIFPIAKGKVISIRRDGPYANLIIEHDHKHIKFWSLYEHISGILINLNDIVSPDQPIAHFMNKIELDRYGWQFDHFHLEVLKVQPLKLDPNKEHPDLLFKSYSLYCYTEKDLNKYYYNPIEFIQSFPDILEQPKGK